MKRDLYETVSGDDRKYEALARQAGASNNRELADFYRGLRDESRRGAERGGRSLARGEAE